MKTDIRLPFVAIALSLSMAACKGVDSGTAADSTRLLDSGSAKKADSTMNRDTSKKGGIRMDDPDSIKKVDATKKH